MIVDANVLLYAVDTGSPHHEACAAWVTRALNDDRRVGFPWQTIGAFLRIATHPRVYEEPLSSREAQEYIDGWLAARSAWVPAADESTWRILRRLLTEHAVTGNLVTDAQLAALAVHYGVSVVSVDSDFARFPEVTWINPLTA